MVKDLTPEQIAEVLEAMARAICACTNDQEMLMPDGRPYWRSYAVEADAALDAALPVIRRAHMEEAAVECESGIAGARKLGGPFALIEIRTRQESAKAIRALAEETR